METLKLVRMKYRFREGVKKDIYVNPTKVVCVFEAQDYTCLLLEGVDTPVYFDETPEEVCNILGLITE